MGRVDSHLVLDRKGLRIERPRRRKHVIDQGLRHAVVLDVEEADGRSRSRQVVGHGLEPCGRSAMQLPDIDDRDRIGIDDFRRGVAHVRPSVGSNGAIRTPWRLEAVTVAVLAAPFKPEPVGAWRRPGPLRPGKGNGYSAAARRGFATSSGFEGGSSNSSASMLLAAAGDLFGRGPRPPPHLPAACRRCASSFTERSRRRPTSAMRRTSARIKSAGSRIRASRTTACTTWIASISSEGETIMTRARNARWITSSKCS